MNVMFGVTFGHKAVLLEQKEVTSPSTRLWEIGLKYSCVVGGRMCGEVGD